MIFELQGKTGDVVKDYNGELRIAIGKRTPILDARAKATGETLYTADLYNGKALIAKILRSSLPHARILHVDTTRAKRIPGVKAVIHFADTPGIPFGRMINDEYILAKDKVHYVGDEVAAVAAADEDAAEMALAAIRVEYEELPAYFSPEAAMSPTAIRIHERAGNNIAQLIVVKRGNLGEGFRAADAVVEQEYRTPMVHQGYIEPTTCIAQVDIDGNVHLIMPNQSPFRTRLLLAQALGLSVDRIRITTPTMGGGFGGKIWQRALPICALLALKSGHSVRIIMDRQTEFEFGTPRVPAVIRVKSGVTKSGKITAKEVRIIADNGAYSITAPAVLSTMAYRMDNLYQLEHIYTEAFLVYTNKVPTGMYRGFGNPQMVFAWERQMDIMAEEVGIDPLELRLINSAEAGKLSPHGWQFQTCGYKECLKKIAKESGWVEKRTGPRDVSPGKRRGIGMAGCIHVSGNRSIFGAFDGSSAIVMVDSTGTVNVYSGESELGQGSSTVFAMIAAEELKLNPRRIKVIPVDTATHPFGIGTFASRVTVLGGHAVRLAAIHAREQLIDWLVQEYEVTEETPRLEFERLVIFDGMGEKELPFSEAAERYVYQHRGQPLIGKGSYTPPDVVMPDASKYGNIAVNYTFAAHAAEVEVDVEIGNVKVLNYWAAHDVGRALNPLLAEGQVEGGVVQGIGWSLTEELQVEQGKIISSSFRDYLLPTAMDIPKIRTFFIESNDPNGPYGAKSLGEAVINPVAAAIANAISHALGRQVTAIPVKPENLLRLLNHAHE